MQNTTTNIATGGSSSPKEQKSENALPRLKLGSTNLRKAENKRLNLIQQCVHFFLKLFTRKAKPIMQHTPAAQAVLIVHNTTAEKKSIPSESAIIPTVCAGTRADVQLRKIAEQQFAEMDISRATMN